MNMKSAALAAFATLALTAFGPQAMAADNGFYFGAGYTLSSIDLGVDVDDPQDLIDVDEDDNGFKVIAGWRPLDFLAIEANYIDLGEGSISDDVSAVTIDTNALTLSGLLLAEIGIVDLFAKVGVVQWNSDVEIDDPQFPLEDSEDGTDLLYGAGIGVHFGSVGVRAEYERFELDDVDIDAISVSVTYTFL